MTNFGYHYPAGAEDDPRAPWNQPDPYSEYGEETIEKKARQLALLDCQIWVNLPEVARNRYRDDAIEELDNEWVDANEPPY